MQTSPVQQVLADEVEYRTHPMGMTHPDRLAVMARLHGVDAPPVDRCRVLEVGCGTGGNLLSMAYALPYSEFTGIDLGRKPIEKARAAAAAAGVRNVRFECRNLMDYEPEKGSFDYVIAYGVYAWVPPEVQEGLMSLIGRALSPQGVAFLCYNVNPGVNGARRLREFALWHLNRLGPSNPRERIAGFKNLCEMIERNPSPNADPPRREIVFEAALSARCEGSLNYHDTLSDWWEPKSVSAFEQHAARHGLAYLEEAAPSLGDGLPENVERLVAELSEGDEAALRQYRDFTEGRRFRHTLLCRAGRGLTRMDASQVAGMYVSSAATESAANGRVRFAVGERSSVEVEDPAVIAAIRRIAGAWPSRTPVGELVAYLKEDELRGIVLDLFRGGMADLHTLPSPAAAAPGPRPRASALARAEAAAGEEHLSSLVHRPVSLDAVSRTLLMTLDGTRPLESMTAEEKDRVADLCRLGLIEQQVESASKGGTVASQQEVLADVYEYPSNPFTVAHTDRMAVLAALAGMSPPAPQNARVLEVGCGEGTNLLSMAATMPGASFLGVDLAVRPIERANDAVKALGLRNAEFLAQDLLDFDASGQFDYIIAHGFYSWVPPAVQHKLLSLIGERLSPQGVAYISFNADPGCLNVRRLRELMLWHLERRRKMDPERFSRPEERVAETQRVLRALDEAAPESGSFGLMDLFYEAKIWLQRHPALLFHDLLGDFWEPLTLTAFMQRAAAHGLQFLSEATPAEPDAPKVAEPLLAWFREQAAGDRVAEQQYVDFTISRRFRRVLLCRSEAKLSAEDRLEAVPDLFLSSRLREVPPTREGAARFEIENMVHLETDQPVAVTVIRLLISRFPERIAVADLLKRTDDPAELCQLLQRLYRGGALDFHWLPSPAGGPGERPRAGDLARYHIDHGHIPASLIHTPVEIRDADGLWLVRLLDGSRDMDALVREYQKRFAGKTAEEARTDLQGKLETLRRLGMLAAP